MFLQLLGNYLHDAHRTNSGSCSSSEHSVWELLQLLGLNPHWTEHLFVSIMCSSALRSIYYNFILLLSRSWEGTMSHVFHDVFFNDLRSQLLVISSSETTGSDEQLQYK